MSYPGNARQKTLPLDHLFTHDPTVFRVSLDDVLGCEVAGQAFCCRWVVFNIKGNDYRLIIAVAYRFCANYIKFIGSQEEYDAIDTKTVEMEL